VTSYDNPGSVISQIGFQNIYGQMKVYFDSVKGKVKEELPEVERSNWHIVVNGSIAKVEFDAMNMTPNQTKVPSREIRLLEKVEGAWKLTSTIALWDFSKANPAMTKAGE